MQLIKNLDDPRLDLYRNLKDRDLAIRGGRFIAEGEHVVRRLFNSNIAIESVVLASNRAEEIAPLVPEGVAVYVVESRVLSGIVGFKFHSGVLACGVRPASLRLGDLLSKLPRRATLVVCPDVSNVDNIGSLVRISAGFGVDAMILGERCHDPFFRQSVRVSMGAVFKLPIVQSRDIHSDLQTLKNAGIELVATVLDEDAEPLAGATRADRVAILFGNEAQGIERSLVDLCDRRVTIPMKLGTDSLNVSVAAGIFLYHFSNEK